ncbi:hypothetical protein VDGL01_05382 [Verticillium dahliae]
MNRLKDHDWNDGVRTHKLWTDVLNEALENGLEIPMLLEQQGGEILQESQLPNQSRRSNKNGTSKVVSFNSLSTLKSWGRVRKGRCTEAEIIAITVMTAQHGGKLPLCIAKEPESIRYRAGIARALDLPPMTAEEETALPSIECAATDPVSGRTGASIATRNAGASPDLGTRVEHGTGELDDEYDDDVERGSSADDELIPLGPRQTRPLLSDTTRDRVKKLAKKRAEQKALRRARVQARMANQPAAATSHAATTQAGLLVANPQRQYNQSSSLTLAVPENNSRNNGTREREAMIDKLDDEVRQLRAIVGEIEKEKDRLATGNRDLKIRLASWIGVVGDMQKHLNNCQDSLGQAIEMDKA